MSEEEEMVFDTFVTEVSTPKKKRKTKKQLNGLAKKETKSEDLDSQIKVKTKKKEKSKVTQKKNKVYLSNLSSSEVTSQQSNSSQSSKKTPSHECDDPLQKKHKKQTKKPTKMFKQQKPVQQIPSSQQKSVQVVSERRSQTKKKRNKKSQSKKNSASPYKMLFFSFLWMIIAVIYFPQEKVKNSQNYLIRIDSSELAHVMNFEVDTQIHYLTINIENKEKISQWLNFDILSSTKTGKFLVPVEMRYGYRIQTHQNDEQGNQLIALSDLEVLSYHIVDIIDVELSDGFFNSWQRRDNKIIRQYVQNKEIPKLKRKAIGEITREKRNSYIEKTQIGIQKFLTVSETSFLFYLRRLNKMLDGILNPIIGQEKVVYENQEDQEFYEDNLDL